MIVGVDRTAVELELGETASRAYDEFSRAVLGTENFPRVLRAGQAHVDYSQLYRMCKAVVEGTSEALRDGAGLDVNSLMVDMDLYVRGKPEGQQTPIPSFDISENGPLTAKLRALSAQAAIGRVASKFLMHEAHSPGSVSNLEGGVQYASLTALIGEFEGMNFVDSNQYHNLTIISGDLARQGEFGQVLGLLGHIRGHK